MKTTKLLITLALCLITFTGCKSDAQKALDKMEELAYEYIYTIRHAKTWDEMKGAKHEFEDRMSFEVNKIMGTTSEEEAEQKIMLSKDISWEDIQRIEALAKEMDKVEREVRNRLK